ncbi:Peptidase M61 domain protein [Candidatus Sulfopaludibacter sp. SbA3]|nr:Peptidase M61 domain protein [Candidatus Sulfopaludibacter sp. SbA3]
MRIAALLLLSASLALAQGTMSFTVSMEHPGSHLFHVTLRCEGLSGEMQDFKMPAWAPGYYRILDFQKYVSNFRAQDGAGHTLPWEKVAKNTWRVVSGNAPAVTLAYDVYGAVSFAVQNYLGETRALLSPPGTFLYLSGHLARPATVTLTPLETWTTVATGLDPVAGRPHTFTAPDFDVLYDSPILMGSQELLRFDVRGVPHEVAIENVPATVDRQKMLADLKKMVETATGLIGDIPYKRYAFLLIGTGNGGVEHLNSASIAFNGNSLTSETSYRTWLSYVAHEYFHNFNVKRIRPIALGPFDYDNENLTNMLWVSEGLSVYYEDVVVERAGLMTRAQFLERLQNAMGRFENATGHHYQSATDSSWHTWGTSGVGNDRNTTISYYDNGDMLGTMLDLKIRHESQNRRSLDDVMRTLYRKYYQEKKRGFTDAEFRAECEAAAGAPLAEVFEYASTTRSVDYAKYLSYAGLAVEVTAQDAPGAGLPLNTQTSADSKLVVVSGPAGLAAGDEIDSTPKALNDAMAAGKPGEPLTLHIRRNGVAQDVQVTLEKNLKRTFVLKPLPDPSALQSAILRDWLP